MRLISLTWASLIDQISSFKFNEDFKGFQKALRYE